jgi:2-polyprenyl-3-methyl-5-hydroxy-6-metoxy-1,4-benzoquinol methylase
MTHQGTCYLCEKSKFKSRDGSVRDNPGLEIVECRSCGLVFLSSFEHVSKGFYESAEMHHGEIDADLQAWIKETEQDDDRRFNFIRQHLTNKSVLDFGCGHGGFLLRARDVSSRVVGIEVEKRLKVHFAAAGLEVYQNLEELHEHFDVITLFHVLEHLPDPVNMLKKLAMHLNKEGRIIIEVPNANDVLLSLYNSRAFSHFTYWSPHLYLFTEKTLGMVSEKAGLKKDYVKHIQRYPLSNHLYWLALGKPGGHKVWQFLDSAELNWAYEKQLALISACDTLFASFSNHGQMEIAAWG